jgi:leader peptidase (prepilin peptidase)/N-methyltransferase
LSLVNSLLGALAGGGLVYLTGVLGKLAFKKESMGGGDVKLMAMLGAFLGWKLAILIFFLAPFFGAPIGLYIKFVKKQDIIPYGPFISLAAFVAMLWGNKILSLFII